MSEQTPETVPVITDMTAVPETPAPKKFYQSKKFLAGAGAAAAALAVATYLKLRNNDSEEETLWVEITPSETDALNTLNGETPEK